MPCICANKIFFSNTSHESVEVRVLYHQNEKRNDTRVKEFTLPPTKKKMMLITPDDVYAPLSKRISGHIHNDVHAYEEFTITAIYLLESSLDENGIPQKSKRKVYECNKTAAREQVIEVIYQGDSVRIICEVLLEEPLT